MPCCAFFHGQKIFLFFLVSLSAMLVGCRQAASVVAEDPSKGSATSPSDNTTLPNDEEPNERNGDGPVAEEPLFDVAAINPFRRRIDVPEFPEDMTWINVRNTLQLDDLEGKFVLLDFWTYCCINCIQVIPELKKLEEAYPNNLVVIGVHSAKFDAEGESQNISQAVLRYGIVHPVVNDHELQIWRRYGVNSWPTLILIDPEGKGVYGRPGEFKFEEFASLIDAALPWYRQQGLLDESPVRFDLLSLEHDPGPLAFPGKILADEASGRLFIADSNHHRIVITDLEGTLIDIVGSGQPGTENGDYLTTSFRNPQGMVLQGNLLYVADTENHQIRAIDLTEKTVRTVAGTNERQTNPWPGLEDLGRNDAFPERWVGRPRETSLGSPWALWIHGENLYIAMAGPHQIWKMPLDESEIGPYAGNGREDIIDGPLLPATPYDRGFSSFAQPSGLTSDGQSLFVADSEGSSIRAVPFDPEGEVGTVVGTADEPFGRLFEFGDVDGSLEEAQMQHALGVTYHEGIIYVADTYNSKIKAVDIEGRTVQTIAGGEDNPLFDEPAGLSYAAGKLFIADTNHHAIRLIDLENDNAVSTLEIVGLAPPPSPQPTRPDFSDAPLIELEEAKVQPSEGIVHLNVRLEIPEGWKLNPNAPMSYWLDIQGESGPIDPEFVGLHRLDAPSATFDIALPVEGTGSATVRLAMRYYYCQDNDQGLCKGGSVVWQVPLTLQNGGSDHISLEYKILP